jgi:hypothetical protein
MTINIDLLRSRMKEAGLVLSWTFNRYDLQQLAATTTKEELLQAYKEVCELESKIARLNRAINHSNHKGR